ncbi:hypothetical protein FHS15_003619 [Paenibacillus castaneae]|uniref:hypothetical protein n=1 Tax=Paenibacillus castaneae TaxID=474957 RepID=UPI0011AF4E4A|nr:hypothetical protein [Paenibacillus castaneae]NIK78481.1 hypothetical protein [Paenibacillus castaneae]
MFLRRIWTVVAAAVILFVLEAALASANGGPLYEPADGSGLLQLDEQSNVSLVREKVVFTIPNVSTPHQNEAKVSVQYELNNKNDFIKQLDVLFFTPSSRSLTIMEGNKVIPGSLATDSKTLNWYAKPRYTVTDPISGKTMSMHGDGKNQTVATRFSLSFEANETKSIVIQYSEIGGMYDKGVINTLFFHQYYVTPAKFWEGDPLVELEVNLYKTSDKLYSNLPMEKTGPSTYTAAFKQLPGEEWYFSYTNPKRLFFPTNIEKDHNLYVLLTSVLMAAIAAGLALFFRKSLILIISSAGIWAFTVFYITKLGGYPFNAIFVGFTDAAVGAMLIVCNVMVYMRIKAGRKNGISL